MINTNLNNFIILIYTINCNISLDKENESPFNQRLFLQRAILSNFNEFFWRNGLNLKLKVKIKRII